MANFEPGDRVKVTVERYMGNRNARIGSYEATVKSVWQCVRGGNKFTDHHSGADALEVNVIPLDWDKACDLYQQEGSMSWTDIYGLRQNGVIENIQVEDVELITREVTVLAHVHVKCSSGWTEDSLAQLMSDLGLELIMAEEV